MELIQAHLAAWMPAQRWYAGSPDDAANLRVLSEEIWSSPEPSTRIRLLVVADDTPTGTVSYQVPVVERSAAGAHGDQAQGDPVIAKEEDRLLIDGPHDPAFTDALLRRMAPQLLPSSATVFGGEQSNTSIVFTPAAPGLQPMICKIFRRLSPGDNPDIVLQTALSDAGCPAVARTVAALTGTWRDPEGLAVTGPLAFAQEFLAGGEDGWPVARRAAADGRDFAPEAHDLGAALGEVHDLLAELFPTAVADPSQRAQLHAQWRHRLAQAIREVGALQGYRERIEEVYRRADDEVWPALQFVHGDFHLGQVIAAPGRGWVILDFEGEPLRPMSERLRPDLALRDVAGMLRSLDYVAGSLQRAGITVSPAWTSRARDGFLSGYARGAHGPVSPALLRALELDKAVYECVYETRHRPDWIDFPLSGIDRLVVGGSSGA